MVSVRAGCEFSWNAAHPTAAVIQVEPRPEAAAVVSEHWESEPELATRTYRDHYGNTCRRAVIPAGPVRLRYDLVADVGDEPDRVETNAGELAPQALPDDTLLYTLPSRFCLSDVLGPAAWKHFGHLRPGYPRVQAICDFVHHHLTFGYGTSTPLTSAVEVYEARAGVCRDFAHLAITFCRALNIPARYAFGYLPDIGVPPPDAPMDFCAWMEVFLEGGWYTFDPRNNQPRVGRVLIGRGRDALDVAMVTTYGAPLLVNMQVWADEVLASGRA